MTDPSLPVSEQADALDVGRRLTTGERVPQYRASLLNMIVRAGTPQDGGFWSLGPTTSGAAQVASWNGFATAPVAYWGLRFTDTFGSGLVSINWEIRLTSWFDNLVADGIWTPSSPLDIEFGSANLFDLVGVGPRIYTERLSLSLWLTVTGGTANSAAWRPEDAWYVQAN